MHISGKYRKKAHNIGLYKTEIHIVDSDTEEMKNAQFLNKKIHISQRRESLNQRNQYQQIKMLPEIKLTIDEMNQDPVRLVMKLQQRYRDYGAVKLIPPIQWQPTFQFKYTENLITTRIQKIHKLTKAKAFDQKKQQYSIKSYSNFAEQFQNNYKFKFQKEGSTKEAEFQNEFWSIVKGPETDDPKIRQRYKLKVQYAADLPASKYGSGFPMSDSFKSRDHNFNYATSFFNLNNIYKSPSSVFGIVSNKNEHISGVTVPWLYMGMLFSTFCWHVQDLWLNSINYNHKGSIKTWYVIPQDNKQKFDAYVLKKTANLDILKGINYIIDPIQLMKNGIKVYKAYQRPKQYILTLFNAYHCGFSQGFNVGQAVNICNVDSFAVMKKAQTFNKLFRKNHKAPVICFDWLIYQNFHNKSLNSDTIKKQYEKLSLIQNQTLKNIIHKLSITKIQMIKDQCKYDKVSCSSCKYYQYFSALRCNCCEKKYCLEHADKCCGKGLTFMTRQTEKVRDKTIKMIEQVIKK